MKYRKAKKSPHQSKLKLVAKHDTQGLAACFAGQDQALLPLLQLVQDARASIDELMSDAARSFVERLLVVSAQEVAGVKHPGQHTGKIRWHGTQAGRITLAERKLAVKRPRLRNETSEVAIPVYERLRADTRLGSRIRDILVTGVSTRKYARVLPEMAGSLGIQKSSVSRHFIKASAKALEELMQRRLDGLDLLALYLDGIVVDHHHILAAVGVDRHGKKHLLGLAQGASENAAVAKDLLNDLIQRGLDPAAKYLFVIDGSKALRSGIEEIFGEQALVQRCRTHKQRNVLERITDKTVKAQTKAVMHAAYKLSEKDGMTRMKQQAQWLKTEYPDAAASLLEGLEETFTVNRLQLTPSLMRCLSTTNIIISYTVDQASVGSGFFVARSGQDRLVAQDVAEFLFLFEKDLTIELQRRRSDLFFIHAAVVELDGKAAIIAAPSGSGKSTTTWGLLHEGFRYLSDELAPVDLERMAVYPYPHALCLKSDPPSPYTLPAATLRTSETLHIPVKFLPAGAVMKPTPLDALFFLNRDASEKGCRVRQISVGEAAARLLANALNPLAHCGDGLDAAIHIAQQARCFELYVTELSEVSSVVRKALA